MPRLVLRIVAILTMFLTLGGVAQVARSQEPVTLRVWAADYTPSRLVPAAGSSGQPQIQGIDPVVAAYQALHPDVQIELIYQPTDGARAWATTLLAGGGAPDIMWYQPDWAAEDYRRDWLVSLEPYLEEPNPYVDGNERWGDQFLPAMDVWRAPDGNRYVVLADQVQVGIYYNEAIFAQAGISEVPQTWEAWMDAAAKIEEAGFFPFAAAGSGLDQLTWVSGWLSNYFYAPLVAEIDTSGDGVVDKTEAAEAVRDGQFSFNDEAGRARLEQLKRWSGYWQPGALAADADAATRLFVTGRAGMLISGSWEYQTIKQDPLRDFDFGVFYFPAVTAETSALVPDAVTPTNKAAGYGSFQFAVTDTAVDNGTVDAAMDFLKFATAPENLSPMITEAGFALPAIRDTASNPDLAPFAESIAYPAAPIQEDDSLLDTQFAETFAALTSAYLSDAADLDTTAAELDVAAKAAAERVLAE